MFPTNKYIWFFSICIIIFIGLALPLTTNATELETYLVKVTSNTDIPQFAMEHQATIQQTIPALGLVSLVGDATLISALEADSRVIAVQIEQVFEGQPRWIGMGGNELEAQPRWIGMGGNEVDPAYYEQWAPELLRVSQAQELSQGAGVTVAVLDSGVDQTHPALLGKVIAGYDFVDHDEDPNETWNGLDDDGDGLIDEAAGHGTHVAGIITLVAPEARILPVRIFDTDGSATYMTTIQAIVYAVEHGADVINLSGNGTASSPFLEEAINYAFAEGVVVVAAGGINTVGYPASYDNVLAVGASDTEDYRTDFAQFEEADVLYAPGTSIYSAYHSGGYAYWTGHSMATPFVSGQVALMRATGHCDHVCAVEITHDTAHELQISGGTHRRIDVFDAVSTAVNQPLLDVQVHYRPKPLDLPNDEHVQPFFKLVNDGTSLPFSSLTLRYWYEEDENEPVVLCDFAYVGCDELTAVFTQTTVLTQTYTYMEIGFTNTQHLLGGRDSGEVQLRFHHPNWGMYDETTHYSYAPYTEYQPSEQITLYYEETLIWGEEPFAITETPAVSMPTTLSPTIVLHYENGEPSTSTQVVRPNIKLLNQTGEDIPLSELTVRYWMSETENSIWACDWTEIACENVTAVFSPTYLEIGFSDSGQMLTSTPLSLKSRIHKTDWSNYNQAEHPSYSLQHLTYSDWQSITIYHNNTLIWGVEP